MLEKRDTKVVPSISELPSKRPELLRTIYLKEKVLIEGNKEQSDGELADYINALLSLIPLLDDIYMKRAVLGERSTFIINQIVEVLSKKENHKKLGNLVESYLFILAKFDVNLEKLDLNSSLDIITQEFPAQSYISLLCVYHQYILAKRQNNLEDLKKSSNCLVQIIKNINENKDKSKFNITELLYINEILFKILILGDKDILEASFSDSAQIINHFLTNNKLESQPFYALHFKVTHAILEVKSGTVDQGISELHSILNYLKDSKDISVQLCMDLLYKLVQFKYTVILERDAPLFTDSYSNSFKKIYQMIYTSGSFMVDALPIDPAFLGIECSSPWNNNLFINPNIANNEEIEFERIRSLLHPFNFTEKKENDLKENEIGFSWKEGIYHWTMKGCDKKPIGGSFTLKTQPSASKPLLHILKYLESLDQRITAKIKPWRFMHPDSSFHLDYVSNYLSANNDEVCSLMDKLINQYKDCKHNTKFQWENRIILTFYQVLSTFQEKNQSKVLEYIKVLMEVNGSLNLNEDYILVKSRKVSRLIQIALSALLIKDQSYDPTYLNRAHSSFDFQGVIGKSVHSFLEQYGEEGRVAINLFAQVVYDLKIKSLHNLISFKEKLQKNGVQTDLINLSKIVYINVQLFDNLLKHCNKTDEFESLGTVEELIEKQKKFNFISSDVIPYQKFNPFNIYYYEDENRLGTIYITKNPVGTITGALITKEFINHHKEKTKGLSPFENLPIELQIIFENAERYGHISSRRLFLEIQQYFLPLFQTHLNQEIIELSPVHPIKSFEEQFKDAQKDQRSLLTFLSQKITDYSQAKPEDKPGLLKNVLEVFNILLYQDVNTNHDLCYKTIFNLCFIYSKDIYLSDLKNPNWFFLFANKAPRHITLPLYSLYVQILLNKEEDLNGFVASEAYNNFLELSKSYSCTKYTKQCGENIQHIMNAFSNKLMELKIQFLIQLEALAKNKVDATTKGDIYKKGLAHIKAIELCDVFINEMKLDKKGELSNNFRMLSNWVFDLIQEKQAKKPKQVSKTKPTKKSIIPPKNTDNKGPVKIKNNFTKETFPTEETLPSVWKDPNGITYSVAPSVPISQSEFKEERGSKNTMGAIVKTASMIQDKPSETSSTLDVPKQSTSTTSPSIGKNKQAFFGQNISKNQGEITGLDSIQTVRQEDNEALSPIDSAIENNPGPIKQQDVDSDNTSKTNNNPISSDTIVPSKILRCKSIEPQIDIQSIEINAQHCITEILNQPKKSQKEQEERQLKTPNSEDQVFWFPTMNPFKYNHLYKAWVNLYNGQPYDPAGPYLHFPIQDCSVYDYTNNTSGFKM